MTITDEQKPYDTRINVDSKTYNSRLHSMTVKEGRGSLVPNELAPCEDDQDNSNSAFDHFWKCHFLVSFCHFFKLSFRPIFAITTNKYLCSFVRSHIYDRVSQDC